MGEYGNECLEPTGIYVQGVRCRYPYYGPQPLFDYVFPCSKYPQENYIRLDLCISRNSPDSKPIAPSVNRLAFSSPLNVKTVLAELKGQKVVVTFLFLLLKKPDCNSVEIPVGCFYSPQIRKYHGLIIHPAHTI